MLVKFIFVQPHIDYDGVTTKMEQNHHHYSQQFYHFVAIRHFSKTFHLVQGVEVYSKVTLLLIPTGLE